MICLAMMGVGLTLLMEPQGNDSLSAMGCLFVILSAFTYAIYIVMVNISQSMREIPTTKTVVLCHHMGFITIYSPSAHIFDLLGNKVGNSYKGMIIKVVTFDNDKTEATKVMSQ